MDSHLAVLLRTLIIDKTIVQGTPLQKTDARKAVDHRRKIGMDFIIHRLVVAGVSCEKSMIERGILKRIEL